MLQIQPKELLGDLLRNVSRSFYLTLRVLPKAVRTQIGLAYLFARSADSIADTEVLTLSERLSYLLQFRELFRNTSFESEEKFCGSLLKDQLKIEGSPSVLQAERKLLQHLPKCFELYHTLSEKDRSPIAQVVTELTLGMELDLNRFSNPAVLTPLETFQELEDYTHHVAGCVGPFWTKMCMAHLRAFHTWDLDQMCLLGIRFGKALQWTNILRDLPRDLANGRCYIPSQDLTPLGLTASDLRQPLCYPKFAPLYHRYIDHALEHYRSAWEYTLLIPRLCCRIQLACIWPIWIGLETLALLRHSNNPLDVANRIRISRSRVYSMIFLSVGMIGFHSQLDRHIQKLIRNASS